MPGRARSSPENGKRASAGRQLEAQPHGGALRRTRKNVETSAETPGTLTGVDNSGTPPAGDAVVIVEQPHGGALQVGNPGNRGGLGVPTSLIRERLRGSYADRLEFLSEVVDGKVMQRIEVPLFNVLPHATCPNCGDQLQERKSEDLFLVTIEGRVSASVKDRIAALDQMAKYAIGTLKEVSVENVRDRMRATMAVIRENTSPELAARLASLIRPLWK